MTAWSNVIKASPMIFGQTSLAHMTYISNASSTSLAIPEPIRQALGL